MGIFKRLYMRSGWYPAFNLRNDGGKARTALLASVVPKAIVEGFTGGTFYTGLLLGHGINIVNISILTLIPYIASLFTIFTPYIMEHFPRRRGILSAARICYYIINILGITLLPELIQDEAGRVTGLIIIVFSSYAINFLFSGYDPWHMHYITADVRNTFFTATTLVSNISSSLVLITASSILDAIGEDGQLALITALRYVSFGIALITVWLMQIPKEPPYPESQDQPKLIDIFSKPLKDRYFRLTLLVRGLYQLFACLPTSAFNAWLLEDVGVSYLYITAVDSVYFLFILFTSRIWNRFMQRHGACMLMIVVLLEEAISAAAYAFANHGNYLWLVTVIKFMQQFVALGWIYGINHIYYETMPREDRIAYTSFYALSQNLLAFIGMSIGTAFISIAGNSPIVFLGSQLTGVPVLQLAKAVLLLFLAMLVFRLRSHLDSPRPDTADIPHCQ